MTVDSRAEVMWFVVFYLIWEDEYYGYLSVSVAIGVKLLAWNINGLDLHC